MVMKATFRALATTAALFAAGLCFDGGLASWLPASLTLNDAHAQARQSR